MATEDVLAQRIARAAVDEVEVIAARRSAQRREPVPRVAADVSRVHSIARPEPPAWNDSRLRPDRRGVMVAAHADSARVGEAIDTASGSGP